MKQNLLKMQKFNLFQSQLATKIKVFSEKENILFGLIICKKLYPDYVKFVNKFGFGNEKVILNSIEYVETFLKQETLNDEKSKTLIDNLEETIPDTDNFSGIEASFALNASASVLELLNYLLDKDITHIIDISNLMFDTIDFRIHEEIKDITDIEIDNHPLFLAEMESQLNFHSNNND